MNKKKILEVINTLTREIIGLTDMLSAIADEQREEQILRAIADREEKIVKVKLLLKDE